MTDPYASLRALIAKAGYVFVEPPLLHDANVFVEVAGEDLRRRLFLTSGADGRELALRPDYTVPVCLAHLAAGAAKRKANYAYLGPVFRQRADEPGESLQAGVESLARTDEAAADADVLKLAFAAAEHLGLIKPIVRIGDSGLFAALLAALDLSEPWRRRLARSFGDPDRLRALIARARDALPAPAGDVVFAALDGADRATVRDVVAEMFASSGLGVIGGRNADEIADRFMEKAALGEGINERAGQILAKFLAVSGRPAKAIDEVERLARGHGLSLGKAVDRFTARLDQFAKRGIADASLTFAADFGRRIDYYTGFVFEFHRGKRAAVGAVIGGGRYDGLMSLLGAKEAVPAVGFAIWLDRIGGRAK
jgi:ATP phosphoribosyltransferase regulatory subunit